MELALSAFGSVSPYSTVPAQSEDLFLSFRNDEEQMKLFFQKKSCPNMP
jgi:hypothetical protein